MNRWKVSLAGVMAAAAFAMPAGAQAAQINDICNVSVSYWVSSQPSTNTAYIMYILGTGAGFRVVGYSGDYYVGHGNGQADGFFPRGNINQASCHQ